MDNWAADFEQNSSKPPAAPAPPQQGPRPPPRDVNPFGQPPTPTAADNGRGGGDSNSSGGHGGFSSATEPPTPTTPPPPIPVKNTTDTTAAAAAPAPAPAPAAEVALENGSAAQEESLTPPPTSPPPPPLPPRSPPRSDTAASVVPGGVASAGAWEGGVGGNSASPPTNARLTGRRKALDETRLFEQRRCQHFGSKFESDSLYWKCFVELIRRSQANNRRAISYAVQKLQANHAYAKSLYAIRDNIDGLEAGTTNARCEKERKERNKKGQREWPPPPDPADRVPTTPPPHGNARKGSKEGGPVPPPQPPSALDWLLVMEEDTAARTLDMCDTAAINVVEKQLKGTVKALDDRFSDMVGKGTACLRLMNSAETNSSKAHARYQEVVTASIAREDDSSLGLRTPLPSRDVTRSDVWLADMNYRVAVTQQARVWTGVSHKLADLFSKLKDIEVERRQAIQGGLMTLLQLQGALLRDLPVLREPAMQSLGRINLDRQLLDQEVRKEMREGATRMMATRREDGDSDGGSRAWGGGGGAATDSATADAPPGSVEALRASQTLAPEFLRSLESPLDSALIARSTMLERREKMLVTSRWPLVLAILTHDSYLLLFDVPKGGPAHKKQLHARTAEAFAELVPKPEVDAMAVELGKHKDGKGVDSGGLPVPPSVAIDLSACQVAFKPDGKSDATFEITEVKPARGMKGVFKDYEETKFTLRGRSQEAMVDWVCEIKEMGRAGLQALSRK